MVNKRLLKTFNMKNQFKINRTTTTLFCQVRTTTTMITLALLTMVFVSCGEKKTEETKEDSYLLSFEDSAGIGYKNAAGEIVIPSGKYPMCFTDTFSTFAIVALETGALVGIDRNEKVLYEVFNYDNGPDYPAYGLFRIIKGGKTGFADAKTGKIVIEPQYDCADPFSEINYLEGNEGQVLSAVAFDCGSWTTQEEDGHIYYNEAEKKLNIFYINTKGEVIVEKTDSDTEEEIYTPKSQNEYKSSEMKSAPKPIAKSSYLGLGQFTKGAKSSKCSGDFGQFQYFVWADNGTKGGNWKVIDVCFSESKNGTPRSGEDIEVYGYQNQNTFLVTSWKYNYNENNEQRPVIQKPMY